MTGELLAAAWEAVTLGELLGGLGLLGGGAGTVYLARGAVRAMAATVRALDMWGRYLEAQTAAARASARLAPLQAAMLRLQLGDRGAKIPADAEDSDELQVMRVAAEGDEAELARLAEQLAKLDPGATLPSSLSRAIHRLVELEQRARARRAAPAAEVDVPRPRERTTSWLRRRART